jgi:hypothetical protein
VTWSRGQATALWPVAWPKEFERGHMIMADMRAKLGTCVFPHDRENDCECVTHLTHLQVRSQLHRSLEFDFTRNLDFERLIQLFQFMKKVHLLTKYLQQHLIKHTLRSSFDSINIHVRFSEHVFFCDYVNLSTKLELGMNFRFLLFPEK